MASQIAVSSIGMALAGKTASVDIPMSRDAAKDSRGGFTVAATRPGQSAMLPTPPNSISPTLPPHGFKHKHAGDLPHSPTSAPMHVDSDIDLQDAVEHAKSQDHLHAANTLNLDSVGAITPTMLAKYHLPDILLAHGPLAIRHVMGYLTTSVPGFAGIPPAKARRLVVGALEGRGNGGEGGGVSGDVIFEKIGWGRWDARRRGQPPRDRQAFASTSPPSSITNSYGGVQIPQHSTWRNAARPTYGTSMADSAVFSHSDLDYGDHEADKMSLDGDSRDYCSSSDMPEDVIPDDEWDEGDVTDEEDWAGIGADALRARSLNGGGIVNTHYSVHARAQRHPGGPAPATLAKSTPGGVPFQQLGFSIPDGVGGDQERAAIEALLRLGSM
ncbi:putative Sin3 binding protein-domain-containing protein [Talaromyces proteolyticus]|uniref:Sin3 binding protein-domain-containing protein n=1 Tax=Talaromyces proteolyticus TaxID=1131652 RepID=A0AAD4KPW5_9EURO|nr:putative Sin3 binding protein-domain-containing protein [Talaromyces proteolyticus]KAH8692874.1 putative Sin3 binding protein-domain-containing protein [Talaromyces proteolyticus]